MASGIARGRVRRTTTTESRNMAAILQITGWQRHAASFGIGHPCYDQLTPVKTRYPLTIIHVTISRAQVNSSSRSSVFLKLTADKVLGFLIGPRAHDWLTCWKQGRIVRKPVRAHPGLNVNRIITFSCMQMFLLLFCVYMVIIENQSRKPNNVQKTSAQSYKTQIKILFFPGLA